MGCYALRYPCVHERFFYPFPVHPLNNCPFSTERRHCPVGVSRFRRLIRGSLSPPRRDFTGVFRRAVTASKTPRKMGLQAPLLAPRLGSFLFLIIRFLLIFRTMKFLTFGASRQSLIG